MKKNKNMHPEGWLGKISLFITIIVDIIFTIFSISWKINFFDWLFIILGGSIVVFSLIIFIIDGIMMLIKFIKTGNI